MKIILSIAFVSIVLLSAFVNPAVHAQSNDNSADDDLKKYEIAGTFTVLRQKSFQDDSLVFDIVFSTGPPRYLPPQDSNQTEYGFGGRLTYNVSRKLALEVETTFFPIDRLSVNGIESAQIFSTNDFVRNYVEPKGRKLQAFLGPKLGFRRKHFGIFVKARPGLIYVDRFPVITALSLSSPASIFAGEKKRIFFSADLGGVFEFYPSKRSILRFDIGDTIIRYNAQSPKQFNPGFTRHTFQFSTSVGFRF